MRKLLFIIFVLQINILFGAESYFSIHYNNIHGNSVFQGMKNEGQSVNICSYDKGHHQVVRIVSHQLSTTSIMIMGH